MAAAEQETAADTKEARKLRALQEKKERGAQALQEAMTQKNERDDIVRKKQEAAKLAAEIKAKEQQHVREELAAAEMKAKHDAEMAAAEQETAADTKEARKLRALQEKKERGAQALQEAMKQKNERDDIVQRQR
jgi:colicin import membrane protein